MANKHAFDLIENSPDFSISLLDEEDKKILTEHGMLTNNAPSKGLEFYFSDKTHLNIVTSKESWISLAGRHWIYDLQTKKIELYCMN